MSINEGQAASLGDTVAPKILKAKEVLLAIAIAFSIFAAISIFQAGMIAGILAPTFLIFFNLKLGRIPGLLILLTSLFMTQLAVGLAGYQVNLPGLLMIGAAGFILSEFLRRNFSIEKTIFYSVLAILALFLVFLGIYSIQAGETPWNIVEAQTGSLVHDVIGSYAHYGIPQEQLTLLKDNEPQIEKVLFHITPALAVISSIMFLWVNVLGARLLFGRRKEVGFPEFGDLTCWKIPDQMVWFVISSGAVMLIPLERIQIAGLNLLGIFIFVYLFQGLSIVNFFFRRKNIPIVIRGTFYFFIFVQHFLLLLVIGLGFCDIWVDFRKLNRIAKDPSETAVEG